MRIRCDDSEQLPRKGNIAHLWMWTLLQTQGQGKQRVANLQVQDQTLCVLKPTLTLPPCETTRFSKHAHLLTYCTRSADERANGTLKRDKEKRMSNLHSKTDRKTQKKAKTLLYFVHCPCAVRACIQSHIQCGGSTNTRNFITGPQRVNGPRGNGVRGKETGS